MEDDAKSNIPYPDLPPIDPYLFCELYVQIATQVAEDLADESDVSPFMYAVQLIRKHFRELSENDPAIESSYELMRQAVSIRYTALNELLAKNIKLLTRGKIIQHEGDMNEVDETVLWAAALAPYANLDPSSIVDIGWFWQYIEMFEDLAKSGQKEPGPDANDPRHPFQRYFIGDPGGHDSYIRIFVKDPHFDESTLAEGLRGESPYGHVRWYYQKYQNGSEIYMGWLPSSLLAPDCFFGYDAYIVFSNDTPDRPLSETLYRLDRYAGDAFNSTIAWSALAGSILACAHAFHMTKTALRPVDATFWANDCVDHNTMNSNRRLKASDLQETAVRMIETERFWRIPMSEPAENVQFPMMDLHYISATALNLEIGRQLWRESPTRKKIGQAGFRHTWASDLNLFAAEYQHLFPGDVFQVQIQGVPFNTPGETPVSWYQFLELERGNISPQALRYFARRIGRSANLFLWNDAPIETIVRRGYDETYGNSLADKLIQEAASPRYAPYGAFRLAIPAETPLMAQEICFWVELHGLWAMPIPGWSIFFWQPKMGNCLLDGWIHSDGLIPSALNATLAAIWHDLVMGATDVLETGGEDGAEELLEPKAPTGSGRHRHKSGKQPDDADPHDVFNHSVLRLPGRKAVRLQGRYQWGSNEEIEKIHRAAHQVRGFPRRLQLGHNRSLQALDYAKQYNVAVPDGYTFVRPYQTGLKEKGEHEEQPETHIVARGLASLIVSMNLKK